MTADISAIGDAPVFAGCPLDERERLRTLTTPLRVKAGEMVVDQGDFGETFGVLLSGRASIWRDGQHIADLVAGDCYGEMALLSTAKGGLRTASVRADTEVRCDTISAFELNAALDEPPPAARALRDLAERRAD